MIDAKVLTIGFDAISKKMSENRMHLISIDQQIGDGDLGISMDNGFKAAADMCCANADTADIRCKTYLIFSFCFTGLKSFFQNRLGAITCDKVQ